MVEPEPEKASSESKRAPLWLRIVLMILLVLFASYGFYVANLDVIENLNSR